MSTSTPTSTTAATPRATSTGTSTGRPGRTVELQQKILAKNDRLAEENRAWLTARGILAVNLMSSPGPARRRCWSAPRGTPAPAWAWP